MLTDRVDADERKLRNAQNDESYFLDSCEGYLYQEYGGQLLSPRLQIIAFLLGDLRGSRFLDIGCGRGELVRFAAEMGATACGVDLSSTAARFSARAISSLPATGNASGRAVIIQTDATRLPFRDSTFDRVSVWSLADRFPAELMRPLVKEVARVAAPTGYVVFHAKRKSWWKRRGPALALPPSVNLQRGVGTVQPQPKTTDVRGVRAEGLIKAFASCFFSRTWAEDWFNFRIESALAGQAKKSRSARDTWGIFWPRDATPAYPLSDSLVPNDLSVGGNAWPCLGKGWLEMAWDQVPLRWTRKRFEFRIRLTGPALILYGRVLHATEREPVTLYLLYEGEPVCHSTVSSHMFHRMVLNLPKSLAGDRILAITLSRTFSPRVLFGLEDTRELGAEISRIWSA